MKRKLKVILTVCLAFVAIASIVFIACTDEDRLDKKYATKKSLSIDHSMCSAGEFLLKYSYGDYTDIITGTRLDSFMCCRTYHDTNLVSVSSVLYTFEDDLEEVKILSVDSSSFYMEAWNEDFFVFNFSDVDTNGHITFNITQPNRDTVAVDFVYSGLSSQGLITDLSYCSPLTIPNPFVVPHSSQAALSPSDWLSLGGLLVSIANWFRSWFSDDCNRKIAIDKANCDKINKCYRKISRCHIACISCDSVNCL